MARRAPLCILFAAWLGAAVPVLADDACVDFKWDVSRERALFAGPATPLTAAADAKSAPALLLDRLYEVKLKPQQQVAFAATPGKKNPSPDSHAGLLTFKIPSSGSYRIAIDMPFYIDVVSNGSLIAATDFQGQHGCSSPHKIVQFDLSGTRPFFLQLSNADPVSVRLTIVVAPARKL
ncbi:MAG TPA: hypothetical protein VHW95_02420 [Steroidobacteraceae bacterium]|jgi:hypothetical protein|nr:hypothetical protein [Steroidobacteraceae bacterium]